MIAQQQFWNYNSKRTRLRENNFNHSLCWHCNKIIESRKECVNISNQVQYITSTGSKTYWATLTFHVNCFKSFAGDEYIVSDS